MKTKGLLFTLAATLLYFTGISQSIQVVEKQYNIDKTITGMIVEGAFTVNYTQGPNASVTIISSPEDAAKIAVETIAAKDAIFLKISATNIKNGSSLIANIESPELKRLDISGGCAFKTLNPLQSDVFSMNLSGITILTAECAVGALNIMTSGTSTAFVSGHAENVTINTSGVSQVNVTALDYKSGKIQTSGVSNVLINRQGEVNIYSSGMSTVNTSDQTVISSERGRAAASVVSSNKVITVYTSDSTDTEVMQQVMDATEAAVDRIIINIGEGIGVKCSKWLKRRKTRFNGHWGGIDIGINGYNTPDFNMDFPPEYSYLDLKFPKSVSFYLNLIECNIPFVKNQKWGMLSGLGFEWHNYRFSPDTWITGDSLALQGYRIEGASTSKSKLTVCYLTVPMIFEFQTNPRKSFRNSFHVGVGVVGGLRIGSHSKIKFDNGGSAFVLTDRETGEVVSDRTMVSGKKILKDRDDFHLAPLKLDATVRIGWGRLNLFATYSIFNMFRGSRGPELYPWSAGITLWGW